MNPPYAAAQDDLTREERAALDRYYRDRLRRIREGEPLSERFVPIEEMVAIEYKRRARGDGRSG